MESKFAPLFAPNGLLSDNYDVNQVIARITAEEQAKQQPAFDAAMGAIRNDPANAHAMGRAQGLGPKPAPWAIDYGKAMQQQRAQEEQALTQRMMDKGLIPQPNERMGIDPDRLAAARAGLVSKGYEQMEGGGFAPGYQRRSDPTDPIHFTSASVPPPRDPSILDTEAQVKQALARKRREDDLAQRRELVRQRGIQDGILRRGIVSGSPGQLLALATGNTGGMRTESALAAALAGQQGMNQRAKMEADSRRSLLADQLAGQMQLAGLQNTQADKELELRKMLGMAENDRLTAAQESQSRQAQNELYGGFAGALLGSDPTMGDDDLTRRMDTFANYLNGGGVAPSAGAIGAPGAVSNTSWQLKDRQRELEGMTSEGRISAAREYLRNAAQAGTPSDEVTNELKAALTPQEIADLRRKVAQDSTYFGDASATNQTILRGVFAPWSLYPTYAYDQMFNDPASKQKQWSYMEGL